MFVNLEKNARNFFHTGTTILCVLLLIFSSASNAQPCLIPVFNNSIQIRPATCEGTVATLQGSNPLGGNGTYSFQWERSAGNCGTNNFQPIPGATARDYAVPSSTDPDDCFRRVVTSGTCTSTSGNLKVPTQDRTSPQPPTTGIVPSGCVLPTGIITITSPVPGSGIFYSINGTTYTNTTGIFSNLAPGVYNVSVKYPAGCISPVNADTVNSLPAVNGAVSPASASVCAGSSQVITANGGNSYQWYRDNNPIAGATGSTYAANVAGTYTADIIVGVCTTRSSNSSVITVTSLPSGSISPATASICGGSSVTLTANGGNSYQWFRNNIPINGATSATYAATQAGSYSVDIINSQGCKAKASNESIVTVTNLPVGSISPTTGSLCNLPSVALTVNGGSSYQWFKDGVAITGATTSAYSATSPGTYTVNIFSGNCSSFATNQAVITQGVTPSGFITPATAALCPGSTVTLTAVTAGGGNTYQWIRNGTLLPDATSSTYVVTQPGTYSVILTNGSCNASSQNIVTISPSNPITFTPNTTQPGCTSATGSIAVNNVTGGGGTYYLYSKDNGNSFQTTNTFNNLTAGTYQVIVKDTFGCISTATAITINAFVPSLTASANVTNISCTQGSGAVTISATGGTSPYQYRLNSGSFQTSNTFQNLTLGNYTVTVRDANSCTFNVNFAVNQTGSTLQGSATKTDARCGSLGSVVLQATGGSPAYSYSLDNGTYQTANTFTNIPAGSHKATIKDQSNCVFDIFFTIIQTGTNPPNLLITNPPNICPLATTSLTVSSITAGSDAGLVLTYWRDTNATVALTNPSAVSPGTYFIKATNTAGCYTIKRVVVGTLATTPGSIIYSGPTVGCIGSIITLAASTGTAYQWYKNDTIINGAISASYDATVAGVYSVYIHNGTCLVQASNKITLQFQDCSPTAESKVFVPTAFTPNRNNANDLLRPILINIVELKYFKLFNRWGQQVFETNAPGKGWDGTINGKAQPSETYSWILECIGKNGEIIKESGRTLLIR